MYICETSFSQLINKQNFSNQNTNNLQQEKKFFQHLRTSIKNYNFLTNSQKKEAKYFQNLLKENYELKKQIADVIF